LNFFIGLEKFNKSEVKNLKELNTKWRKELAWLMKKENLNSLWFIAKMFFKLKHKKERIMFFWQKVKRLLIK
jgi:hypothetical protein